MINNDAQDTNDKADRSAHRCATASTQAEGIGL